MARVRGPLMSFEASGNFAGQMQFRCNRYGGHVYRPPDPVTQNQRPATVAQTAQREKYALGRAAWNTLDEEDKIAWNATATASKEDVTGFNLFMQMAMTTGLPQTCPLPYTRPGFDAADATWLGAEEYIRPAFDAAHTAFIPNCNDD